MADLFGKTTARCPENKSLNWRGVAKILDIMTRVENPCHMLRTSPWFHGKIQDFVRHLISYAWVTAFAPSPSGAIKVSVLKLQTREKVSTNYIFKNIFVVFLS